MCSYRFIIAMLLQIRDFKIRKEIIFESEYITNSEISKLEAKFKVYNNKWAT